MYYVFHYFLEISVNYLRIVSTPILQNKSKLPRRRTTTNASKVGGSHSIHVKHQKCCVFQCFLEIFLDYLRIAFAPFLFPKVRSCKDFISPPSHSEPLYLIMILGPLNLNPLQSVPLNQRPPPSPVHLLNQHFALNHQA